MASVQCAECGADLGPAAAGVEAACPRCGLRGGSTLPPIPSALGTQPLVVPPKVTTEVIREAEEVRKRARDLLEKAERRLDALEARHAALGRNRLGIERYRLMRQLADRYVTRPGGLALVALAGAAGSFLVAHMIGFRGAWLLLTTLGGAGVSATFGFRALVQENLDAELARTEAELASIAPSRQQASREAEQARRDFDQADDHYGRVLDAFHGRLNRLRAIDWRALNALEFERAAALLLEELGYEVEPTRAGDGSASLVASRDGLRTAIVTRATAPVIVTRDAVQQAEASKDTHRCQRAAILTNSTFATSARRLATRLRCVLIEGQQIPDLIERRLSL